MRNIDSKNMENTLPQQQVQLITTHSKDFQTNFMQVVCNKWDVSALGPTIKV